jgi:hypothetical protein
MKHAWSAQDLEDFQIRNWTTADADEQIECLLSGANAVDVTQACTTGKGIDQLTQEQRFHAKQRTANFPDLRNQACRFVPASGAASRMFGTLRKSLSPDIQQRLEQEGDCFPFWTDKQRAQLRNSSVEERVELAIQWMLDPENGWSHLPKGLIPFHRYDGGVSKNSFQEHTAEWHQWMGDAPLHFTVPESYQGDIAKILPDQARVSLSTQHPQTDALAWDLSTQSVARHSDGRLLFRPGGHGALLRNLKEVAQETPYLLIRNIDNVVGANLMAKRNEEEAILLGECLRLTEERDTLIANGNPGDATWRERARNWLKPFNSAIGDDPEKLMAALDRPIRVAGMVRNEGAPGGGPFWVRYRSGWVAPAIVESAELPAGALGSGTHFNPVDLVCSTRRADGSAYNLDAFQDASMYFTAKKDWDARPIRIYERPGLWNGSMANWLTRFIEVPSETFAPVKTVMDLLDRLA